MKTNELQKPPRQKTSVAIKGLDTSTTDDLVEDGACDVLEGVRYEDNAWRPVLPPSIKCTLRDDIKDDYEIRYHHPAAGDKVYVANYNDEPETYVSLDLSGDEPTSTPIGRFGYNAKISHFGNILMFANGNNVSYVYLKNGEYIRFAMPEPPRVKSITKKLFPIRPWKYTQGNGWKDFPKDGADVNPDTYMVVVWPIADMMTGTPKIPITPDASYEDAINSWHGEVAFFVAYEMVDGTIIAPSLMSIIASEKDLPNNTRVFTSNAYGGDSKLLAIEHNGPASGDATSWVDSAMHFVIGEAQYVLPADINTELITNVVCFCTRINSIFDYGKIIPSEQSYSGINIAYANNALPTQPFYLLASKPLSANSTIATFNLNAKSLINIVTNRVYQPNNNIHLSVGNASLDYNNSLHLADITTKLFEGYNVENFISPTTEEELKEYTIAASLKINDALHYSKRIDTLDTIPASPRPAPRIITYPDFRAKQFFIQHSEDITSAFDLTPAAANNVAYYIPTPTSALKYPEISFGADLGTYIFPDSNAFAQTNRLIVSSPNNPFSFPFENSYSFGSASNRILAMQSAAIEMHEMKVGEMPLYVFTEEGVFALVAGSNTLYSSVAAINYDKIINPNTLAINGNIVYITDKGVHLLSSEGISIISSPIDDTSSAFDTSFFGNCQIISPHNHREIIFFNPSKNPQAYVYNLEAGLWSTRWMKDYYDVKFINKGEMLYNDKRAEVTTIRDVHADSHTEGAYRIWLRTRPMKLGNVEYKRLETIIPRIDVSPRSAVADSGISLFLEGSVLGEEWRSLRDVNIGGYTHIPPVIRRTPYSAKYFRIEMHANTPDVTLNITHIDFEWYSRFLRRMR